MQITEAKAYLTSTDWIVTKMAETAAAGGDLGQMAEKYDAEVKERAEKRSLINEIENGGGAVTC